MPGKGDNVIEIPAIRLSRMEVRIIGQTPLLTHRFGDKARDLIEGKQQGRAKAAKEARNPIAEYKDACYPISIEAIEWVKNSDNAAQPRGSFGFPAAGLKRALVSAGGRFADEQQTRLKGALNIQANLLTIYKSDFVTPMLPHFRADTVRLSGIGRVASVTYRPEYGGEGDPWAMKVPIVFSANIISPSQVANLLMLAGFSVGIGDWRPERNGTHGQFILGGELAQLADEQAVA